MKMKYFLRGLGIGILSATILLFGVYSYKMSDSKIVEKARELGMEYSKEKESETENLKDEKDASNSAGENSSKENNSKENSSKENDTKEDSTKEDTTTLSSQQESTSKKPQPTTSPELIDINISSGMNSESVSDALEAAGVIHNAKEFNQYLVENNMGRYIKSGEYRLKSGMSYKEIADILQRGQ